MGRIQRWNVVALAAGVLLTASTSAMAAAACGDVNANGTVTSSDALAVLKEAVGQPVNLQCGAPAQPLKTGDTINRGSRSDGFLETGVARSFLDNGDGTITDDATGLTWEKKDNAGGIHDRDNEYTWSTGNGEINGTIVSDFLAGLNASGGFAGHTDWRIPNRFELETLLNAGEEVPSTWPVFATTCNGGCTIHTCSCTLSGYYWTSTTFQSDTSGAWAIRFNDGGVNAILKTTTLHARAVRGGL
ncbi:MAG TPA: DUF1566 domain-containing protein [Candidatus Limnocylindrales bacterium]|nr:DUF1566 domain-containing protein [Candidatus Limnocylindrales bacterium]